MVWGQLQAWWGGTHKGCLTPTPSALCRPSPPPLQPAPRPRPGDPGASLAVLTLTGQDGLGSTGLTWQQGPRRGGDRPGSPGL